MLVVSDLFDVVSEFSLEVVWVVICFKLNALYHSKHRVLKLVKLFYMRWRSFRFETVRFLGPRVVGVTVEEKESLPTSYVESAIQSSQSTVDGKRLCLPVECSWWSTESPLLENSFLRALNLNGAIQILDTWVEQFFESAQFNLTGAVNIIILM